jgi:hypothetical protein
MHRRIISRRSRDLITSLLLVALVFRAYVPLGFMPAAGAPFMLELCPAAAPVPVAAHHAHHHPQPGGHDQFDHCPFGSASAPGPLANDAMPAAVEPLALTASPQLVEQPRLSERPDRAHQPRAPPHLT